MLSTITYRKHSHGSTSSRDDRRGDAERISARYQLLQGSSRTAKVQQLKWAISRFDFDPNVANKCEVALFEIAGDDYLHCNVTHRHATHPVSGWAGPGCVPDGFVYNRRFSDTSEGDIIRHIRQMVVAQRL